MDIKESLKYAKLGVRIQHLDAFIAKCGGRNLFRKMNTTDVCKNHLMPLTERSKSSYCEMLAKSNNPKDQAAVGTANVFVCHAWKYIFLEVVDSLLYHFRDQADVIIWFDVFSYNQHGGELDKGWWSSSLPWVIGEIGHTVMVWTAWNHAIPLSRTWCLYELYCSFVGNTKKLEIVMNGEQEGKWFENMAVIGESVMKEILGSIDIQNSECTDKAEKAMIMNVISEKMKIRNGPNVDINTKFNELILSILRDWMIASVLQEVEREKNEDEILIDEMKVASLQSIAAELYTQEKEYAKAERCYKDAFEFLKTMADESYYITLQIMFRLGLLYKKLGRVDEAENLFQHCYEYGCKVLGEEHAQTITYRNHCIRVPVKKVNVEKKEEVQKKPTIVIHTVLRDHETGSGKSNPPDSEIDRLVTDHSRDEYDEIKTEAIDQEHQLLERRSSRRLFGEEDTSDEFHSNNSSTRNLASTHSTVTTNMTTKTMTTRRIVNGVVVYGETEEIIGGDVDYQDGNDSRTMHRQIGNTSRQEYDLSEFGKDMNSTTNNITRSTSYEFKEFRDLDSSDDSFEREELPKIDYASFTPSTDTATKRMRRIISSTHMLGGFDDDGADGVKKSMSSSRASSIDDLSSINNNELSVQTYSFDPNVMGFLDQSNQHNNEVHTATSSSSASQSFEDFDEHQGSSRHRQMHVTKTITTTTTRRLVSSNKVITRSHENLLELQTEVDGASGKITNQVSSSSSSSNGLSNKVLQILNEDSDDDISSVHSFSPRSPTASSSTRIIPTVDTISNNQKTVIASKRIVSSSSSSTANNKSSTETITVGDDESAKVSSLSLNSANTGNNYDYGVDQNRRVVQSSVSNNKDLKDSIINDHSLQNQQQRQQPTTNGSSVNNYGSLNDIDEADNTDAMNGFAYQSEKSRKITVTEDQKGSYNGENLNAATSNSVVVSNALNAVTATKQPQIETFTTSLQQSDSLKAEYSGSEDDGSDSTSANKRIVLKPSHIVTTTITTNKTLVLDQDGGRSTRIDSNAADGDSGKVLGSDTLPSNLQDKKSANSLPTNESISGAPAAEIINSLSINTGDNLSRNGDTNIATPTKADGKEAAAAISAAGKTPVKRTVYFEDEVSLNQRTPKTKNENSDKSSSDIPSAMKSPVNNASADGKSTPNSTKKTLGGKKTSVQKMGDKPPADDERPSKLKSATDPINSSPNKMVRLPRTSSQNQMKDVNSNGAGANSVSTPISKNAPTADAPDKSGASASSNKNASSGTKPLNRVPSTNQLPSVNPAASTSNSGNEIGNSTKVVVGDSADIGKASTNNNKSPSAGAKSLTKTPSSNQLLTPESSSAKGNNGGKETDNKSSPGGKETDNKSSPGGKETDNKSSPTKSNRIPRTGSMNQMVNNNSAEKGGIDEKKDSKSNAKVLTKNKTASNLNLSELVDGGKNISPSSSSKSVNTPTTSSLPIISPIVSSNLSTSTISSEKKGEGEIKDQNKNNPAYEDASRKGVDNMQSASGESTAHRNTDNGDTGARNNSTSLNSAESVQEVREVAGGILNAKQNSMDYKLLDDQNLNKQENEFELTGRTVEDSKNVVDTTSRDDKSKFVNIGDKLADESENGDDNKMLDTEDQEVAKMLRKVTTTTSITSKTTNIGHSQFAHAMHRSAEKNEADLMKMQYLNSTPSESISMNISPEIISQVTPNETNNGVKDAIPSLTTTSDNDSLNKKAHASKDTDPFTYKGFSASLIPSENSPRKRDVADDKMSNSGQQGNSYQSPPPSKVAAFAFPAFTPTENGNATKLHPSTATDSAHGKDTQHALSDSKYTANKRTTPFGSAGNDILEDGNDAANASVNGLDDNNSINSISQANSISEKIRLFNSSNRPASVRSWNTPGITSPTHAMGTPLVGDNASVRDKINLFNANKNTTPAGTFSSFYAIPGSRNNPSSGPIRHTSGITSPSSVPTLPFSSVASPVEGNLDISVSVATPRRDPSKNYDDDDLSVSTPMLSSTTPTRFSTHDDDEEASINSSVRGRHVTSVVNLLEKNSSSAANMYSRNNLRSSSRTPRADTEKQNSEWSQGRLKSDVTNGSPLRARRVASHDSEDANDGNKLYYYPTANSSSSNNLSHGTKIIEEIVKTNPVPRRYTNSGVLWNSVGNNAANEGMMPVDNSPSHDENDYTGNAAVFDDTEVNYNAIYLKERDASDANTLNGPEWLDDSIIPTETNQLKASMSSTGMVGDGLSRNMSDKDRVLRTHHLIPTAGSTSTIDLGKSASINTAAVVAGTDSISEEDSHGNSSGNTAVSNYNPNFGITFDEYVNYEYVTTTKTTTSKKTIVTTNVIDGQQVQRKKKHKKSKRNTTTTKQYEQEEYVTLENGERVRVKQPSNEIGVARGKKKLHGNPTHPLHHHYFEENVGIDGEEFEDDDEYDDGDDDDEYDEDEDSNENGDETGEHDDNGMHASVKYIGVLDERNVTRYEITHDGKLIRNKHNSRLTAVAAAESVESVFCFCVPSNTTYTTTDTPTASNVNPPRTAHSHDPKHSKSPFGWLSCFFCPTTSPLSCAPANTCCPVCCNGCCCGQDSPGVSWCCFTWCLPGNCCFPCNCCYVEPKDGKDPSSNGSCCCLFY